LPTDAEAGVWRATFSRHATSSAEGFGAAATPWGAVQEALGLPLRISTQVPLKTYERAGGFMPQVI